MAEVFVTEDVPCNFPGSNNLALPSATTNLYGIDTIKSIGENYGELYRENLKSLNHWRFQKKHKTYYLKILFQS